jgi:hypothetical protein
MDSCVLEDLEAYMEKRDLLFAQLQEFVPSPKQVTAFRPFVVQIREQDAIIAGKMTELRNEANREIVKLNKGKRTKSMYESPSYGDDSLFFDTKR